MDDDDEGGGEGKAGQGNNEFIGVCSSGENTGSRIDVLFGSKMECFNNWQLLFHKTHQFSIISIR